MLTITQQQPPSPLDPSLENDGMLMPLNDHSYSPPNSTLNWQYSQ